jgi:hypothetical protein
LKQHGLVDYGTNISILNCSKFCRLCNFLRRWVNECYYDFERNPELIEEVSNFVNQVVLRHDRTLEQIFKGGVFANIKVRK